MIKLEASLKTEGIEFDASYTLQNVVKRYHFLWKFLNWGKGPEISDALKLQFQEAN